MNPLLDMLKQADSYVFDSGVDMQIINAHRQGIPFVGAAKIDIPLSRCYFFENQVEVSRLHHLTKRECSVLQKILKEPGFNPYISFFVLYESRVIAEGSVNAAVLAHALFHFHHRVARNYILQDYVTGIYE